MSLSEAISQALCKSDDRTEYRTAQRSSGGVFRCAKEAMRYLLRLSGMPSDKVRHIFYLMRREMLSLATHDLSGCWGDSRFHLSPQIRSALEIASRQTARSALKEMGEKRITGTDLTEVTSLIEVLRNTIARYVTRQQKEVLLLRPDVSTTYQAWPGVDSLITNTSHGKPCHVC